MGGHNRSSGQTARRRRERGVPYNNDTQSHHATWFDADDIKDRLGVSEQQAQDYFDAVNGGSNGGFTKGWDAVIRAYEQGLSVDEIMNMSAGYHQTVQELVDVKYNGDRKAYMAEVAKKARNCESLIDASPKWDGGELMRGFKYLDADTFNALTTVGAKVDLNRGTASWSTDEEIARSFANGAKSPGSFIAHCSSPRRGTSIRNLSHYDYEEEVLCSSHEAFICTGVRKDSQGRTHAYYDLVDTNYDWSSVWKKKK